MCKLRDTFWHRRRLNHERKLFVSEKNVNNLPVRRKDFGLCNLDEDLRSLGVAVCRRRVVDATKILVRLEPSLLVNVPPVFRIFELRTNVSGETGHPLRRFDEGDGLIVFRL